MTIFLAAVFIKCRRNDVWNNGVLNSSIIALVPNVTEVSGTASLKDLAGPITPATVTLVFDVNL